MNNVNAGCVMSVIMYSSDFVNMGMDIGVRSRGGIFLCKWSDNYLSKIILHEISYLKNDARVATFLETKRVFELLFSRKSPVNR